MQRRPLVAGNWKMHGNMASINTLCQALSASYQAQWQVDCAVIPPFVYIEQVKQALTQPAIKLGAQNVSKYDDGAYTGEVSATMLADLACDYVLIGHSERRNLFEEQDSDLVIKYQKAVAQAMRPILCVGESLEQRELGLTEAIVLAQIDALLSAKNGAALLSQGVLAYEPVWAIGTGKTATPEQAQEVHAAIRQHIASVDAECAENVRILYGGSVKSSNAAELFAMADIDGGLIGGASLDAKEFLSICEHASACI